jgi:hypothetical protein
MGQHIVFHNRPDANSMNNLLNILDICSLFPFNDLYLPTYQLSPSFWLHEITSTRWTFAEIPLDLEANAYSSSPKTNLCSVGQGVLQW